MEIKNFKNFVNENYYNKQEIADIVGVDADDEELLDGLESLDFKSEENEMLETELGFLFGDYLKTDSISNYTSGTLPNMEYDRAEAIYQDILKFYNNEFINTDGEIENVDSDDSFRILKKMINSELKRIGIRF